MVDIDEDLVQQWSLKFLRVLFDRSRATLSGGLRAQCLALRDERSSLFVRVQRAKHHFKRAQARLLMESVASMDQVDREIMSASVGIDPVLVDASGITLCRRTSLVLVRLD